MLTSLAFGVAVDVCSSKHNGNDGNQQVVKGELDKGNKAKGDPDSGLKGTKGMQMTGI